MPDRLMNMGVEKKGVDNAINERIETLMLALGLNANSFSLKTGVGISALHKILKNQSKPGYDTLKCIIDSTKVNETWLMSGSGPMFFEDKFQLEREYLKGSKNENMIKEESPPYQTALLVGELELQEFVTLPMLDARAIASFTDNIYGTMRKITTTQTYKVLKIEGYNYEKAFVLNITGDSMLPNFRGGMKVVVREVPEGRWDSVTGIHAISVKDGMFTIKRIISNKNNVLILRSDNPAAPEETEIQVADILAMFRVGEIVYAPPVQDI